MEDSCIAHRKSILTRISIWLHFWIVASANCYKHKCQKWMSSAAYFCFGRAGLELLLEVVDFDCFKSSNYYLFGFHYISSKGSDTIRINEFRFNLSNFNCELPYKFLTAQKCVHNFLLEFILNVFLVVLSFSFYVLVNTVSTEHKIYKLKSLKSLTKHLFLLIHSSIMWNKFMYWSP